MQGNRERSSSNGNGRSGSQSGDTKARQEQAARRDEKARSLAQARQQKLNAARKNRSERIGEEDRRAALIEARLKRAGIGTENNDSYKSSRDPNKPTVSASSKSPRQSHEPVKSQQVDYKRTSASSPSADSVAANAYSKAGTNAINKSSVEDPALVAKGADATRILRSPKPDLTRIQRPAKPSSNQQSTPHSGSTSSSDSDRHPDDATVIQKRPPVIDADRTRVSNQGANTTGAGHRQESIKSLSNERDAVARATEQPAIRDAQSGDRTVIGAGTATNANIGEGFQSQSEQSSTDQRNLDHTDSTSGKLRIARAKVEAGELVLKQRFVLEQLLGAGGMGMVYKARDLLKVEARDRDPYVAVKVLNEEFRTHPEAFISLQRESRKSQRIAHPNIVNVHDFDRDGDDVFMTMEFLDGTPLDKLISQYRSTGLAKDEAVSILNGLCSALEHAHAENIIHSDFKPGNIFVTNKGLAKVFDFGIARAVAQAESYSDDPKDQTVFDAGNLGALTPTYASKEMLEGKTPDVRDDIYALGCIAYEMFTGKHPFGRVNALEASKKGLAPDKPANLSKYQWLAVEKALAFDRKDRIQTVTEFWQLFTRKRRSYFGLAASAILFLALGSFAAYSYFQTPEQLDEAQIRESIARELRLEQQQANLDALIAEASFSEEWETTVYRYTSILKERLGDSDPWLMERETQLRTLYEKAIQEQIDEGSEESLNAALGLIENSKRYGLLPDRIAGFEQQIIAAREAIAARKLELAQQQAARDKRNADRVRVAKQATETKQKAVETRNTERRDRYNVAMATVEKQLICRNTIDMSDIKIAVNKLKSIDGSRFASDRTDIIRGLTRCINKIGRSYPDKALAAKSEALSIFPGDASLTNIKIATRQGCGTSIAGLGARGKRATCRDELAAGGFSPLLVVVPSGSGVRPFAIGKYEVTKGDMKTFCASSGQCDVSGDQSVPAANLSLSTIRTYLRWLSDNSGKTYRLPSASEWKYAARAGGQSLDSNRNCKLSSRGIEKGGRVLKATIGRQNKWGLVNTAGNIQELVSTGGRGVAAAGGSFDTPLAECTANTLIDHNGNANKLTGFRVLRQL